jgi:hypothetical protein
MRIMCISHFVQQYSVAVGEESEFRDAPTTSASKIYCCTQRSKTSCMFCGIVCSIRSCRQMPDMATAQLAGRGCSVTVLLYTQHTSSFGACICLLLMSVCMLTHDMHADQPHAACLGRKGHNGCNKELPYVNKGCKKHNRCSKDRTASRRHSP